MMKHNKNLTYFLIAFISMALPLSVNATIEVRGTIAADTVWTSGDVYLVTGDITVNPGVKLTINPGTIVKFNSGRRIYVNNGILVAVGQESDKIIFTSYRDDSVGGDTNGDGFSYGQPGDWNHIRLYRAVACPNQPCDVGDTGSEIAHVEIRYGGSGTSGSRAGSSLIEI